MVLKELIFNLKVFLTVSTLEADGSLEITDF